MAFLCFGASGGYYIDNKEKHCAKNTEFHVCCLSRQVRDFMCYSAEATDQLKCACGEIL